MASARASPRKSRGWLWASAAAPARQQAAQAHAVAAREAVLDRLAWQIDSLRANLEKAAAWNAVMARELGM
jgi:hypothetical protein